MGMQGPLVAQALGRSPYDDVVQGEGEEDPRMPRQQYDHGGRPINPDTVRINRDIIRSHNQVMFIIGIAEPENPGPEIDSQRRHGAYEESVGLKLASSAKRCVEAVGIFGVNGLRDRILIYKRYSKIPFWDLYQQARRDFSVSRDILPGAPANLLSNYIEFSVARLWLGEQEKLTARRCLHEIWSYIRIHLELHISLQRLGLIPSSKWLPSPSWFIPFSEESPIVAPPPLESLGLSSILQWVGGLLISNAPFIVFVVTQRMVRDWKPHIWAETFKRLPSTVFRGKTIPQAPPSVPQSFMNEAPSEIHSNEGASPVAPVDSQLPSDASGVEVARRPSIFSARGDDFDSDEEDNDVIRATLISFDVEATESTDAPQGLWSAELRPSVANTDSRGSTAFQPTYLDTLLTQIPALLASHMLANSMTRLLMTPYDATALRLVARAFCVRKGLPLDDILETNLLSGFTWTTAMNYLGTEFFHLLLTTEVWAVFTGLSQWYHFTEEEWAAEEAKN
ncbi:hypothetical protein M419DRAFT_142201 [Trichoderma reesei RUT C-30]|uniref:Uncharacterized protein n=1 Tax=Hypocrea jecorina (strain ATCC 56765 / BCRC 32924 / NRRL 11460 / Rut C-30) TaxID=1344414 RepID=A0A024S4F4_HYPJR|nr:hypothetical protein M419DRAFT_142201 [Trichoderma reesei RUT C-30]